MNTSITLSQLPYTGFDYGDIYNSLYWVALLVWSMLIAFIIIKSKSGLAKMLSSLAKVFIVQKQIQTRHVQKSSPEPEPVILEERVVKFDPLVDPITHSLEQDKTKPLSVEQSTDTDIKSRIQELVHKELAISRVGQTPDEFSNDDFGIVDFDGVNPDDNWQPREKIKEKTKEIVELGKTERIEAVQKIIPKVAQKEVEVPEIIKIYKDTITLNTDSEFPKIILSREDVTNY